MKTLTCGIEIETIGQTRRKVAEAIQTITGGRVERAQDQTNYDPWDVIMSDGRRWRGMTDASLNAARDRKAEVVSPILKCEDLETLQNIVRAIREAGAKVDESCGIHIHVDAAPLMPTRFVTFIFTMNELARCPMPLISASFKMPIANTAFRRATSCAPWRASSDEFFNQVKQNSRVCLRIADAGILQPSPAE